MVEVRKQPRLHVEWIDRQATEIVERLQKAGYTTYLVGGCVRDLLAGRHPKDFDIATNALPNEVRRKVWGSYVIGKRFRLVLAKRKDQQYEIATFRRAGRAEDFMEGEEPFGDNFFGSSEEDALRRDFTINAIFYDPIKDELIDYAKGIKDIEARLVRMIGDPQSRILEDAIRSLRAVRLAHKLRFSIDGELRRAIQELASEVAKSALLRRREEYLKLFRLDDHVPALCELYDLHLMEHLWPSLKAIWDNVDQRDIFIRHMHQMKEIVWDHREPFEIYLSLILAFDEALAEDPQLSSKRERFMRDELGMFKSESAEVFNVMSLSCSLPDINSFKKRGGRRQAAFLRQQALPYALRIAKMERRLSPYELEFWRSQS